MFVEDVVHLVFVRMVMWVYFRNEFDRLRVDGILLLFFLMASLDPPFEGILKFNVDEVDRESRGWKA